MIRKPGIKNIIKWFLKKRLLDSYIGILKGRLDVLKKKGLFRTFPYDKVKPCLTDYPFKNSTDRFYFDFFYSVSSVPDPCFIPATTYLLYVEPALNDIRFAKSIDNKALYDKVLNGIDTPGTVLRKINNFFYDRDFNLVNLTDLYLEESTAVYPEVILKAAVESGGGMNIRKFRREAGILTDGKKLLSVDLLNRSHDFILQEVIVQHEFYSQFNPGCNNTLRILTYKSVKDNSIHILHSLLRIGQIGSFMDHDNLGGIVVGISPEGRLNDFGCDVNGIKYNTFNGINFMDLKAVPFIDDVKSAAVAIAEQVYYGRFLAIDFSVDRTGKPVLLEINCEGNGTDQYQMNNGPLFGEYTKEILDYCASKDSKYFLKI